jgi:hypothetical protein
MSSSFPADISDRDYSEWNPAGFGDGAMERIFVLVTGITEVLVFAAFAAAMLVVVCAAV